MKKQLDQSGFTLLETMLVVAILCITLGVAGMSIFTTQNNKLKSYALELTWDIRELRYESITEGNTDSYIRCMEQEYFLIDNLKVIKKVQFHQEYKIVGGGMSEIISFNENGVPIHPQTIQLINTQTGEMKKITIVVNTGRVLLYE